MENLTNFYEAVANLRDHGSEPGIMSYDGTNVYAGGLTFNCNYNGVNPRFVFAKCLSLWPEPTEFEQDIQLNFCNTNTETPTYWVLGSHCNIGDGGFGIVDYKGERIHMPHHGNVVICDGVRIRNNVCIDRAVLGSTYIGPQAAIDNFVHVAHGVQIGQRAIICAHATIGGSVVIGDDVFIGIGALIKNKIKIGNNVTIGAGAVVVKDVPDNTTVVGNPAIDFRQQRYINERVRILELELQSIREKE